eukprot:scaffold670_cov333-Pavlova_lutheri.AAC.29
MHRISVSKRGLNVLLHPRRIASDAHLHVDAAGRPGLGGSGEELRRFPGHLIGVLVPFDLEGAAATLHDPGLRLLRFVVATRQCVFGVGGSEPASCVSQGVRRRERREQDGQPSSTPRVRPRLPNPSSFVGAERFEWDPPLPSSEKGGRACKRDRWGREPPHVGTKGDGTSRWWHARGRGSRPLEGMEQDGRVGKIMTGSLSRAATHIQHVERQERGGPEDGQPQ